MSEIEKNSEGNIRGITHSGAIIEMSFLPQFNERLHSTFRIVPDDVKSCLLYVIEGVKRCTHSSRIVRNASQTALTASARESPQLSM